MNKPLAKSLHTVTVLVRVARLMKTHCGFGTNAAALTAAMIELGYHGMPDPSGLEAAALVQLNKGF